MEVVIVTFGKKEVTISSCSCHVSVSCGCYNKLLSLWRLRTIELSRLPVLEVRFPCLFPCLEEASAFLGSDAPPSSSQGWPVESVSCSVTHLCFHGCTSLSLPLTVLLPLSVIRTRELTVGPPPDPRIIYFKILDLIKFVKSFLPSKLMDSQVPGTRMWTAAGGLILLSTCHA